MRPRRQKLHVSTFPFLAVLLCAMGSLILLLLVIDRRAKAVARAKALRAAAQLVAADEQAAAQRAAELERRRQALHAELLGQDQEVKAQVDAVRKQADEAARRVQEEESHTSDLQKSLREAAALLAQKQGDVKERQTKLAQATAQTQDAKNQLTGMTADLLQLERTLTDLQLARQRTQQKYSVVPYHGRRGDNRRPLYVECTAEGLVFHPDRKALEGSDVTAAKVRAEFTDRLARRPDKDQTPYVLMLVRPSGIDNYYRTLAALSGLTIDFGYEFIEPDWVLDFPEKDDAPARPPWMTAEKSDAARPGSTRPEKPAPPAPPSGGLPLSPLNAGLPGGNVLKGLSTGPATAIAGGPASGGSGGTGSGQPGTGAGGCTNGAGQQGAAASGPPGIGLGLPSTVAGGAGPNGSGLPGSVTVGSGGNGMGQPGTGLSTGSSPGLSLFPSAGASPGQPAEPGRLAPIVAGQVPGIGGAGGAGGWPSSGTGTVAGPGTGAAAGAGPGAAGGPAAGANLGKPIAQLGGGAPSAGGGSDRLAIPGGPAGQGTALSPYGGNSGSPSTGSSSFGELRAPQSGGAPGAGGQASSNALSLGGSPGAALSTGPPSGNGTGSSFANPAPSSVAGGQAASGPRSPAGSGYAEEGQSGSPSDSGQPATGGAAGRPTYDPLPPAPSDNKDRPRPGSSSRVIPERDWILEIHCSADGVSVIPGGVRLPLNELSASAGAGRLQDAVRQLLARRQAMARPTDPPYRAVLRFVVQPEGLRTYYLAYPALTPLQVPMIRENVRKEDAKK